MMCVLLDQKETNALVSTKTFIMTWSLRDKTYCHEGQHSIFGGAKINESNQTVKSSGFLGEREAQEVWWLAWRLFR